MSKKISTQQSDSELEAIGQILRSLSGLDGESIQRVLEYVFGRLSLGRPGQSPGSISPPGRSAVPAPASGVLPQVQLSIRDLKESKRPESANQMAALVAYYLSDIAPEGERKEVVVATDLVKYFKQAGFALPRKIPQTLPNAAAAGYFDAEGAGRYKLNPVGYNLIVHALPRSDEKPRSKGGKKKRGKH